jgi:hypothetical protein
VELSEVAELQVLLEGVALPSERSSLLTYAVQQGARGEQLGLLRRLPERAFETIDDVAEELVRVQPRRERRVPHEPREESDAVPGGEAYRQAHPESGRVRDLDAVSG